MTPFSPRLTLFLCLLPALHSHAQAPATLGSVPAPEETMKAITSSREALAKWIETQKNISAEEGNWRMAALALDGRIALVKQELGDFEGKVSKSSKDVAGEDTRKANLDRDLESAKKAPTALLEAAAQMESQLKAVKGLLPEPVMKKVGGLYERMPEDPKVTKASLAERFQNILGILNETDKANNEIMLTSEVREFPGVKPSEVQTIYIGLGQAYFVNADHDFAGMGRPVQGKWQWTRDDKLAAAVAEVLAVMANKGKPHFIQLPATVE